MRTVAVVGGVAMFASGFATAYSGFSAMAMTINLTASAVLLLWLVGVGVWSWRGARPRALRHRPPPTTHRDARDSRLAGSSASRG
jgi:membrane protein implicated in regulation of membrane protease activity